jgi:hypothetical protein
LTAGAAFGTSAAANSWSSHLALDLMISKGNYRQIPGVVHTASAAVADSRAWGMLARAGGPVAGVAGVGFDLWSAGTALSNRNYEDAITEGAAAISLATMMRAPHTMPVAGPVYAGAKLKKPVQRKWFYDYCIQGGMPVSTWAQGM